MRRYNPSELDEWLPPLPETEPPARRGPFTMPETVQDGARNVTLYRLARSLHARKMGLPAILAALEAENQAKCAPPLPAGEVADIAQHAMTQPDTPTFATATGEPEAEHFTDTGNAARLVREHGAGLRYVREARIWARWDGRRFALDGEAPVIELAKSTARAMLTEAATLADPERRAALARHATRSEHEARLRAMVALAASDPRVLISADALDADPDRLNLANGLLDLATGQLGPHDPGALCTKLAPVAFDPAARCPRWLAFLSRILNGDRALLEFLQRALGYALGGRPIEQVVFFLYGTGANGKSTLLNVVGRLLGDYARFASVDSFLTRKHAAPGIGNDLVRLRAARFVWAMEPDAGRRLAESLIKSVTGDDPLIGRRLYGEYEQFPPSFVLFLGCNHKPRILSAQHAMWRRVRLLPFVVTIAEPEQDKTLAARLVAEEGPGILAWLVAGHQRWRHEGLGKQPDAVRAATAAYRDEQDTLGGFFTDRCVMDSSATVTVDVLYVAYSGWAVAASERTLSKAEFGARVAERGGVPGRTKAGRFWRGLRLRTTADPVPEPTAPEAVSPW
jgi:putative DNA primase/helicase